MRRSFDVPFLETDVLRAKVDAFLQQYHPSGELNVPVNDIVDNDLGIDVIPVDQLQAMFRINGCCSTILRVIWVDRNMHDDRRREYRYRFTLAHELGHFVLHEEVLNRAEIGSAKQWVEFVDLMPEGVRSKFEWQAHAFAGLLLVPPDSLLPVAMKYLSEIKESNELKEALKKRIRRSAYLPYVKNTWAVRIAPAFNVSYEVIERRLEDDGLLDYI